MNIFQLLKKDEFLLTKFNENIIEEPDNDVFVMAQKESCKCNLCSFKCVNIEALEVHKNDNTWF